MNKRQINKKGVNINLAEEIVIQIIKSKNNIFMNTKDKLNKIGSPKPILKKDCSLIINSKKITIKMTNIFLQSS